MISAASGRMEFRIPHGGRPNGIEVWQSGPRLLRGAPAGRFTPGWRRVTGRVIDVSANGAGLVLHETLAVGARVRVTVASSTDDALRLGRQGRLAWVQAAAAPGAPAAPGAMDATPSGWRAGVDFHPLAPGSGDLIASRLLLAALAFGLWLSVSQMHEPTAPLWGAVASVAIVAVAAGREWGHRLDLRSYRREAAAWQREWGQHSQGGELAVDQRDAPSPVAGTP